MTITSVTKDGDDISYVEDGVTKKLSVSGSDAVVSFPIDSCDRIINVWRQQSDGHLIITYIDTNGDEQEVDIDPNAGGTTTFLGLTDALSSYSGLGGQYIKVKGTEDGLESGTPAGSGDMEKTTYDTNDDGKVDAADDADTVGGEAPAAFEDAGTAAGLIASHADDDDAHHAVFTTTEHTAIGNNAPHHAKYTDAEAIAAAKTDPLLLNYTQGARVYHNEGSQSVYHDTPKYLTFDSERYDTNNIHSTTENPSRLTCNTPGKYLISAHLHWSSNPTGIRYMRIMLNGSIILAAHGISPCITDVTVMEVTTIYELEQGDYVEVQVIQRSGTTLFVEPIPNGTPEFMMQRIG